MPFSAPSFKWDTSDFDVPDNVKDRIKFLGSYMNRNAGDTVTVGDASRVGAADIVSENPAVLYWYDSDNNNTGGIRVGAKKEGSGNSNPADFNIRQGGETVTVPGSDQPASANTAYHVYFVLGDAAVSISTNKADGIGYDRVYLGRITTGDDQTDGTGGGGGSTGGGDDGYTLK